MKEEAPAPLTGYDWQAENREGGTVYEAAG